MLEDRVDAQLDDRVETAPILAAVGGRLAASELSGTVDGARVVQAGEVVEVGRLPVGELPPVEGPGRATVTVDGDRWRLLTVEVADVPRPGDRALVQLVAPLGDVDARADELRRRAALIGVIAATVAGLIGFALGRRATRPLTALRNDADRWDDRDPSTWTVDDRYGSPEVDDVAAALNISLSRLSEESERRTAALDAARAFAASATHELRTPLQSALTNIDIARSPLADEVGRVAAVEHAHVQLQRIASGLAAVRALADAEFAEASWFAPNDLAGLVASVVDEQTRQSGLAIDLDVPDAPVVLPLWSDGARLAVGNVVRNALLHGRTQGATEETTGGSASVRVAVQGGTVIVDDGGPGIAADDRARLVRRFERGSTSTGSGLGLAIAHQVAVAHGGSVTIGTSPMGGARVVLAFSPSGRLGAEAGAASV